MEQALLYFRIQKVIRETPDTRSYILQCDQPVDYKPGQFLTFLFNINNKELRRSYSIVSLPGEPLKVTVKRIANGEISRYISDNWTKGKELTSLLPAGRFHLEAIKARRDVFCLAAGSGITAILPQIKYLLQAEPQSVIQLVYSNTNEQNTIFLDEISQLANHFPDRFIVHHFFSDPEQQLHYQRRLNNGTLEELVNAGIRFDPANAAFLLCGPFTYMRMVRITLIFMGFEPAQILREIFQPEGAVAIGHKPAIYPEREITISWLGKPYNIVVPKGQTILRAAMAAGLMLPYSCEGGVCSTCSAICKQGKVAMSINEVLTEKELAEGWVLTCTGHPVSEGVILQF